MRRIVKAVLLAASTAAPRKSPDASIAASIEFGLSGPAKQRGDEAETTGRITGVSEANGESNVAPLARRIRVRTYLVRDDGFRKVLLLDDPREQRLEFIAGLLVGLVQEANSWPTPDAASPSASL